MARTKHPKALSIFFGTEMWERYGFYVIQTLLALYLTSQYHLSDGTTYALTSSFTALTYISPLVGGWIADNFLGQKITVTLGAVVLILSYFAVGMISSLSSLTLALAGMCVGTGLFKPNISSMLGFHYKPKDPMRDSGFTLFYVGISLGIILGTLLPIHLQEWYGWSWAFYSAGFGLIIALFIFWLGCKKLNIPDNGLGEQITLSQWLMTAGICIVIFAAFAFVFNHLMISDVFFIIMAASTVGIVLWNAFTEKGKQRYKTLAFLILCGISVVFWMLYFQMFLSLTLFIHRLVTPKIWGISFPPPYYVTLESVGLVVFGPLLAKFWLKFKVKGEVLGAPSKFAIALTLTAVAYLLVTFSAYSALDKLASPTWILLAYGVIAVAELSLSPVGLSVVTKLIPPEKVSVMMGVFFVSLGVGARAAGWIASLADIPQTLTDRVTMDHYYLHAFEVYSCMAILAAIIAWMVVPLTRRLIRNTSKT